MVRIGSIQPNRGSKLPLYNNGPTPPIGQCNCAYHRRINLARRSLLQKEIDSLHPIDYDDLMEAADLLKNFRDHWEVYTNINKPEEAHQQLLAKIVDRVFVYDQQGIGVALHSDFGIVWTMQR